MDGLRNRLAQARGPWALWLAFSCLHAALFYLDLSPDSRRPFGDEVMYRTLAQSAARGTPGTLELLWPPLYVWLLTPFAALGDGWPHLLALFQVALLGLSALLFHPLLTRITGSSAVADIGRAFLLLDPHLAAYAHYAWPEVVHIALLLLLLWLLVARPAGPLWWLAAGLTAGALCLTKSVLQPYLPLLLLPLARDLGWRTALLRATGIAALASALLLPVAFSNWRTQGAFIVADSSRLNLWIGLNSEGRRIAVHDSAGPEFLRFQASAGSFAERQALLGAQVWSLVRERGVVGLVRRQWPTQYFRLFDYRTFMTEQFAGGPFLARGVGYANPDPLVSRLLSAWNAAFYALVLAAGGVGLLTTPVRTRPWLALLFGIVGYSLCLFLVLESRSRYRLPLMPALWAAAAMALVFRGHGVARWRVAAGLSLSCLLLALAFGADYLP